MSINSQKNMIFLSGSMRSGKTLFANILNLSDNCSISIDSLKWFWEYFYNPTKKLNYFHIEKMFYDYHNDIVNGYIRSGKKNRINSLKEILLKNDKYYDYNSLLNLFLKEFTKKKELLGFKVTQCAYWYNEFNKINPDGHIFHIERDIHDIYYSHKIRMQKPSPVGLKNQLKDKVKSFIAEKTNQNIENLIKESFVNKHPIKIVDQFFSHRYFYQELKKTNPEKITLVRYEDLVSNFDMTFDKINEKLNYKLKKPDISKLNFSNSSHKKNLKLNVDSIGKSSDHLTNYEIEYIKETKEKWFKILNY